MVITLTLRISKQEQKIVVNDNSSGYHDKNDNNLQGQKMVLVFLGSTANFIQDSSHTMNMIMGKKSYIDDDPLVKFVELLCVGDHGSQ